MRETLAQWKAALAAFLSSMPRLTGVFVFALALSVLILIFKPALLTVTAYKLSLVVLAAWLAYYIDRALFPYARPHKAWEWAEAHRRDGDNQQWNSLLRLMGIAMLRRAIIVAAVVLAIALGA